MNVLTLTLALVVGTPGQAPDGGCTVGSTCTAYRPVPPPARHVYAASPVVSPYGSQYVSVSPKPLPRQIAASPYGMIRYDRPATVVKPTDPPKRFLPAISVSRPTRAVPTAAPRGLPLPIIMPPDGYIPPPQPSIPLSNFQRAITLDRPVVARLSGCPADWLTGPPADWRVGN